MTNVLRFIRDSFSVLVFPAVTLVVVIVCLCGLGGGKAEDSSVLLEAAARGDDAGVVRTLASGTPVNAIELGSGMTPLMHAAAFGRLQAARLLLEHGADLSVRTRGCGTPLAHAARSGGSKMVQFLIEHGADPNLCSEDGFSPLMHAVASADMASVEELLAGGADVTAVDRFGQTALTVAISRGNAAVLGRIRAVAIGRKIPGIHQKIKLPRREMSDLLAVL